MDNINYKPAKILLVEDDDVDAMGIKRALSKARIANELHRARDGKEAIDMLRSGEISQPYIILLDLNMPRMNGMEFLEEIRSDEVLYPSVVFVLTTSGSDEDVFKSYSYNIAGYIVKTKLDKDFKQLLKLLGCYWTIVELPGS